jgi:ABC-type transporter Mla subunit MlaD
VEGRGIYVRIGLLIVCGAALLVGLIWFLGGARINHGVIFESYFQESVQGLEVGAPVKYRGVTIGRVTDIGLVSAQYGAGEPIDIRRQTYRLVFVRGIIDTAKLGPVPDLDTAVNNGLRARLASQGITGLSYVELDFVDPVRYPPLHVPWTPKAPYIPSVLSTLSHFQDAAEQLLTTLNRIDLVKIADELTGLLTDARMELTTGDVHRALAAATSLMQSTQDAVRAADLPGLAADVKQTSDTVRDTVQGQQMQRLLANADLAVERLATAAAKLPPMIETAQATARRADNSTADIEQSLVPVLRDIQATVTNLRELSEALRRNPAQAVFGGPPPRSTELSR